jgi:hypothetical protein
MSTLTARPMSVVKIEFQELYERHLCRHSQWGINVAHLLALFFTWFGVYGFIYWQVREPWVPIALAGCYLAVMLPNVPLRVWLATVVFLAIFLVAVVYLPELPFWIYLLMIPVFYELQSWSHKLWSVARDMTEFEKKYTKGAVLFVVLLIYEVPLVLNYLVFAGDQRAGGVSPLLLQQTGD